MTWDETIKYIRTQPEFKDLIIHAYFDDNLQHNVARFSESEEYKETLKHIKSYAPEAKSILDIGCGNGISAINFALKGYQVTAVEPDKSDTVGSGAIKNLKAFYKLENIEIFEAYAEEINFKKNTFDMVYIRQAMHHANELDKFIRECVRVLKPNGLLLTTRDHVICNETDKNWFLETHPLHKFYGGENAFSSEEYKNAIHKAGAQVVKEFKYYDSVINYFPQTEADIKFIKNQQIQKKKKQLYGKIGILSKVPFIWSLYSKINRFNPLDENIVPGRMYSYIAIKK
jgi:ubiquinone/menaquinone biosynthesis C-methylase UbiE